MILNVLMILFSVVYIIDISGVMDAINKVAYKLIYGADARYKGDWYIPLFGCSKCLTFWCTLVYCICNAGLVESLFIACIASFMALPVYRFYQWLEKMSYKIK